MTVYERMLKVFKKAKTALQHLKLSSFSSSWVGFFYSYESDYDYEYELIGTLIKKVKIDLFDKTIE